MIVDNCIFCVKGREEGDLHQVSTFDADSNARTMITVLQDTKLPSHIDGGDLIAKEAKYHLKCLTSLRNRYRVISGSNIQMRRRPTQQKRT